MSQDSDDTEFLVVVAMFFKDAMRMEGIDPTTANRVIHRAYGLMDIAEAEERTRIADSIERFPLHKEVTPGIPVTPTPTMPLQPDLEVKGSITITGRIPSQPHLTKPDDMRK